MRLTIELVTAVAMISRFRRWLSIALAYFCLQRLREVAHQLLRQVRILRHVGVEQLLEQHQLRVRQQHRQFRPGQAQAARLALGDLGIGRQELDLAVEQALRFQRADEVLLGTQARQRSCAPSG